MPGRPCPVPRSMAQLLRQTAVSAVIKLHLNSNLVHDAFLPSKNIEIAKPTGFSNSEIYRYPEFNSHFDLVFLRYYYSKIQILLIHVPCIFLLVDGCSAAACVVVSPHSTAVSGQDVSPAVACWTQSLDSAVAVYVPGNEGVRHSLGSRLQNSVKAVTFGEKGAFGTRIHHDHCHGPSTATFYGTVTVNGNRAVERQRGTSSTSTPLALYCNVHVLITHETTLFRYLRCK